MYNKPVNAKQAIIEYESNNDLSLFETEVGLFDVDIDPNFPYDSVWILIAAEALEKAKCLVESQVFDNLQDPTGIKVRCVYIGQVEPEDFR